MRATPDEIAALEREAVARGGKAFGIQPPDPSDFPNIKEIRSEAPGLAFGRHEFTIPGWRPALKNELKKGGHWGFARLKKRDRVTVAEAALIHRIPKAIRKRRLSVEVTLAGRMREVDPDAIDWSLRDALVAAGLLVDDSPQWLEPGTFVQIRGATKATRIILEDVEDMEESRS